MPPLLRRRPRPIARAVITDPERHTVMDAHGAVRSVQAADLTLPAHELERRWSAEYLERLARTYWRFLSRVTLGLIRVSYGPTERAVVLLHRPLVLLRFFAPEYELDADGGRVRWRIRDGVLVAPRGRDGDGLLEIEVRRLPCDRPGAARVRVQVKVANYYPTVAVWLTRWLYAQTQARIHVLVTHGFLRSLARLDLAESGVGRFAGAEGEPRSPQARGGARSTSSP